ncbi:MAG: FlgD immunoglobulin-like domain containing protein [Candidatus Krumholzibacteriia bacterium]
MVRKIVVCVVGLVISTGMAGIRVGAAYGQAPPSPPHDCSYPDLGEPLPWFELEIDVPAAWAEIADTSATFASNFSIYVSWNVLDTVTYPSPGYWPCSLQMMKAFASEVMPDSPVDPWAESLAYRITEFYGVDAAPQTYEDMSLNGFTHFNVYFKTTASSTASDNSVYISVPPLAYHELPAFSLEYLLGAGFAHEWQHLVDPTRQTVANHRFLPGSEVPTSEFFSQFAEHVVGWYCVDYTPSALHPAVDLPYKKSLVSDDYWNNCLDFVGGSHNSRRQLTWSLFAPYMLQHYDLGDYPGETGPYSSVPFEWIFTNDSTGPPGSTRNDLKALADMLADGRFDPFFNAPGGADGSARVREMYENYFLSLWVNSNYVSGFPDSALVWCAGEAPQERDGYLQQWDFNCHDDARSMPLYHFPYFTPATQASPVYPKDLIGIDSECAESMDYPSALQLSSYSHNVLPFVGGGSTCWDLRVDITIDSSYECPCPIATEEGCEPTVVQTVIDPNDHLTILALGYPAMENPLTLDLEGDTATLLHRWEATGTELGIGEPIRLRYPCFGGLHGNIVLLMILTKESIAEGGATANILPYHYTYWIETPDIPTTIAGSATWPEDLWDPGIAGPRRELCLSDNVEVLAGAQLQISPGTLVFFPDYETTQQFVLLTVRDGGTLNIGSPTGDLTRLRSLPGETGRGLWGGIQAWFNSTLNIDNADLLGPSGVAQYSPFTTAGTVSVKNSRIMALLTQYPVYIDFKNVSDLAFENVSLLYPEGVKLGLGSGSGDWDVDGLSIFVADGHQGSALSLSNTITARNVQIQNAFNGIDCTGTGEITLGDATVGNSVSVVGRDPYAMGTAGIRADESVTVNVTNAWVSAFETSYLVDDYASLWLRNSEVSEDCTLGVYVASRYAVANLGDPIGSGRNCVGSASPLTGGLRVFNRSSTPCWARGNYWDTTTPTSNLFAGTVYWTPFDDHCEGTGGINLAILPGSQGDASEPEVSIAAYPNPANPSCSIDISLPSPHGRVSVSVFDIMGRVVRTLHSGDVDGDVLRLPWDGLDGDRQDVASGVYLVGVDVDGRRIMSAKLVQIR